MHKNYYVDENFIYQLLQGMDGGAEGSRYSIGRVLIV